MDNLFEEGLSQIGIDLSEKQKNQFIRYYEILIEWNKVMNLTSITDFNEVVTKHFIDSLSIVRVENFLQKKKIIDIGTGAGFPGLPIKIAFPDTEVVLFDSLKKRIGFLKEVIADLELKKIEAVHGRAEEFGRKSDYREVFDCCVSRAVAKLSTLTEYCIPYVKIGGTLTFYKAGEIEKELDESKNAIHVLGGKIVKVDSFKLPYSDIERSLVYVRKEMKTPQKYPRGQGKPMKEPIHLR